MFHAILAVSVGALGFAATAAAQNFPTQGVKFIVPFTAGGANDGVARAMADRLSKKWGQAIIVENRAGGATVIGTRAVIDAAPDGHTLLFTSSTSLVVTPHTTKLPFDPLKDLAPVFFAVSIAPAMAIGKHVPAKTVAELIAYAKANPGKLTYASAGTGTYSHVATEYFKQLAGIDMLHVPYKGTSGAVTDMLGGRIDVFMVALGVFQDLDKSGMLNVAALATPERHPDRPNLPTIGETVPGYGIDVWFSFSAPAKTPDSILDKLHSDMADTISEPSFIEGFVKPQAFTPHKLSRAQFAERMRQDFELWGRMVESAGLKKQP